MNRNLLLGSILIVSLIAIWMFSGSGETNDTDAGNLKPAVVEPEAREPTGRVTLDGDVGEAGVRVPAEAQAEPAVLRKEEPVVVESSSAATQGNARVWLVGRVLDADGNPVAERELRSRFHVHQGMLGQAHFEAEVRTDADGRFRQAVEEAWTEKGTPMIFELFGSEALSEDAGDRKPSSSKKPAAVGARATFIVPTHLASGGHDLGEAELRGPVMLASGRAVDGRGDPAEGADVSIRWGHSVTVPAGADPQKFMQDIWWMLDDVGARSNEEGIFELVGFVPDAPLKVEAQKDGSLDAEPVACAIGATDLEVVLHAGGSIAGRILFDDGIPLDRFQVEIRVAEGMAGFRRLKLDEDGGFEAEGLPPGQGLVSLVLKPDRDTLVEIDDVGFGTTYRDPRCNPLDMRGALTMATVTVVGADGSLLETADGRVVGLHFPDTASRSYAPRKSPGILSFLGMGDGLELEIWAIGYRAKVLTDVRGKVEVQLEPGTPVHAELTSRPPLEEGESLIVMLEVEDEYWRQVAEVPIEVGASAELFASHEGRHQFSLWLVITSSGNSGRIRIQSPEAALEFNLDQSENPGVQKIVLTEEALKTARESWRRFR